MNDVHHSKTAEGNRASGIIASLTGLSWESVFEMGSAIRLQKKDLAPSIRRAVRSLRCQPQTLLASEVYTPQFVAEKISVLRQLADFNRCLSTYRQSLAMEVLP
ncbi:MAG: hypothetical protein NTV93_18960 [Verrucomicrobia bacterium]|nr:hypothetical protein [Verrucomicrobiota bacterium]